MESETKYGDIVLGAPPLPIIQPHNGLKFELIDDDICIDNFSSSLSLSSPKTYLQDFHHLDQLPSMKASSSFNPDIERQLTLLDPFLHGFDLYEDNKAYDYGMAMQSFQGFANRKDMFIEIDIHDSNPNPLSILVTGESSCVTADHNGERGGADETKRGRRKAKSGKGGQWTTEEDMVLIHLVEKFGEKKWSRIAQLVKGRIGKQCRERWHNHLRPDIKKDVWTEEEDRVLIEGHAEIGNKWAEIAKRLPGRTENSIKNHWNATKRRQQSRRKSRTKWPRPSSLLQNYINSLSTRSRNTDTHKFPTNHVSYEIDDVPDLSFMDDLAPQIQDEPCFHSEFPFDMPPLMQHELKMEDLHLDQWGRGEAGHLNTEAWITE